MPAGFTSTAANRQPVFTGDDCVLGKVYATGGLDLSGAGVPSGTNGILVGQRRNVVTAAATLTAAQSGSLCLWNLAAGFTYTLPTLSASLVGIYYDFHVTVTATSVAHKVIAGAGQYLIGVLHMGVLDTTPGANPGPKIFTAGATDIAISMAGSTTGGLIGTHIRVEAATAATWAVTGIIVGSGAIATPFATS